MPKTETAPASGRSSPATMRRVVVLELSAPDGEIQAVDRRAVEALGQSSELEGGQERAHDAGSISRVGTGGGPAGGAPPTN
jgi:hypothetical protein